MKRGVIEFSGKSHGLPGLGVGGDTGAKGEHGTSSFVGPIQSFFDKVLSLEEGFVYVRSNDTITNDDMPLQDKFNGKKTNIQYYTGDPDYDRLGLISLYRIKRAHQPGSDPSAPYNETMRLRLDGDNNSKDVSAHRTNVITDVSIQRTDGSGYKFAKKWSDWRLTHDTNTYDTTEIGNLSSNYVKDDLLFVTDASNHLMYCVPVTESLVGKSYDVFSKNRFVPCDDILTNFTLDAEKAVSRRGMVFLDFGLSENVEEFRQSYTENFINHNIDSYGLSGAHNDDTVWKFMEINATDTEGGLIGTLPSSFDRVNLDEDESLKGYIFGSLTKPSHIDVPNLYIKPGFTNINVPEYHNDGLMLDNGYRCPALSSGDVDQTVVNYRSSSFLGTLTDGIYGCIIYRYDVGGNDCAVEKRYEAGPGESISIDLSSFPPVEHDYVLVNYCGVPGGTVYYSIPSVFRVTEDGSLRNVTIQYADGLSDTMNLSYDGIEFMSYNLTPSVSSTELRIECPDYSINDVYINGTEFVSNQTLLNATIGAPSWFRVDDTITQDVETKNPYKQEVPSYFHLYAIECEDNIPDNDYSSNARYVEEYLYALSTSGYTIGEKLADTVDRDIVVTCVVKDDSTDMYYRANHRIIQPKFTHPGDISIGITPLIKDGLLEASNDADNGILCNQLQYFLDLDIEGFTEDTWGKYLDNPTLNLYFKLSTNHYESKNSFDYLKTTSSGNIRLFAQERDIEAFPNNAVRAIFGYVPNMDASGNELGVSYDSSLTEIERAFVRVPDSSYKVYVNDMYSDDGICPVYDGWLTMADIQKASEENNLPGKLGTDETFHDARSSAVYYDFGMDGHGFKVQGISIPSASLVNRNRLRVLLEFANPIPAEIDLNFRLTKMEVVGHVKDMYRSPNYSEAKELVFTKSFPVKVDDIDNLDTDRFSGIRKFVINPVYMTVADSEYESKQGLTNIRTSRKFIDPDTGEQVEDEVIKITGSEQGVSVLLGLYGEDFIKDVSNRLYYYDANAGMGKRCLLDGLTVHQKIEMGIPDYKNFVPLKRYLQDNILSVYVKPRSLMDDISLGNTALTDVSRYMDMFVEDSSFSAQMKNVYNVYPLSTDGLNPEYQTAYLSLFYNSDIMHPKMRSEEGETFYFNNTLYKSVNYAQKANTSPLLGEQTITIPVRSEKLLDSISAWNMEYEVSNSYNHQRVMGGVMTKSGDGYTILPSNRDYGQYEDDDNILSLEETKSLNDTPIFTDDVSVFPMTEPQGIAISPTKGKFFRTLLWNMDWLYPNFMTSDTNDIRIYPYYFCNSYEYRIDVEVTDYYRKQYLREEGYETSYDLIEGLWRQSSDGYNGILAELISKGLRMDLRGIYDYVTKKTKMSVSQGSVSEGTPINVVNSMLPYNVLYNIYPRTMVNTDADVECVNVLMLQQPTVTSKTEYGLSKHYFKVSDNASGDKEFNRLISPWKFG